MLVDPAFAAWIRDGIPKGARDSRGSRSLAGGGASAQQRFADYEQVVAGRTNGLVGAGGRVQLPWPRALGTPPWGARHELELGASAPGTGYEVTWVRHRGRAGLERAYAALRARVRDRRPALLYIGNARLPRHVVLVMPPTGEQQDLDVYEPSVGRVLALPRRPFVDRRLRLAGWDVAWAVVWARPSP
jgi:hypothetical protein